MVEKREKVAKRRFYVWLTEEQIEALDYCMKKEKLFSKAEYIRKVLNDNFKKLGAFKQQGNGNNNV